MRARKRNTPDLRRIVVYVAGPFRGANHYRIRQNVRRAEAFSLALFRAGLTAVCPHTMTANFQGVLPDEVWLEATLNMMLRCDAVLLILGWRRSRGAREERKVALAHGIPVFTSLAKLLEWAKRKAETGE